MTDQVVVRRGAYHDSVTLMLVSRTASAVEGVDGVAVAMATPLNLELLRARGFDIGAAGDVTANDLVIAIRADQADTAERALAVVDRELSANHGVTVERTASRSACVSLLAAVRQHPELSLAVLSVPGRYVAYEAATALEAGLHVFCFSDRLGLEEEAILKHTAIERGLLFMGADCGTAIIDGVALGFANRVRRGPVGIVGASGSGIQELSCLLDLAGVGVSSAIGVGGRDLAPEIGGAMMRRGLELLASDPDTEVIVAISKPPDPAVARAVRGWAAAIGKPVILTFVGLKDPAPRLGAVEYADGIEAAATRAAELVGSGFPALRSARSVPAAPGEIRGLFSGGTLCTEAMTIVAAKVPITSNVALRPDWRLDNVHKSDGHTFIDFGSDEFTEGRAHPIIDPTLRLQRVACEARDPAVRVILLDIVLGYGAHPDPAAEFAPIIAGARAEREDLAVVVALIGTDRDPQGLHEQLTCLEQSGAIVTRSVADAARVALSAVELPE